MGTLRRKRAMLERETEGEGEIDHGVAAVRTNVDGAHKREGEREDGAGSGAGMLGQS